MRTTWPLGAALAAAVALPCCAEDRASPPASPTYDADVAPILARRCAECHAGGAPAAGWRAAPYLSAIACVAPSGAPATVGGDAAPIVSALDGDPHAGRLDPSERAVLSAWVRQGAPAFRDGVHPPGIVDPRSPDFHAKTLRALRWAPMLDSARDDACGRCHDGAPSRPAGVTLSAPGAPSCTSCHDRPGGALACGTCHGDGDRAYPPRDRCFFPGEASGAGAHAAHVEPGAKHARGLACSTCHPAPSVDPSGGAVMGGTHGNGGVEVAFDPSRVAPEASFDRGSASCSVSCHDRGGARARPAWSDPGPMTCNGCHTSPPARHYAGPCTTCHHEANADGTALSGGPLHANGRVDLGDGGGGCGACHGKGDDPWPTTKGHPAHARPTLTTPIACESCHVVPTSLHAPGHMDGHVDLVFSGRAVARGASPTWDGASCQSVACHGANLVDPPLVPAWGDASGAPRACGACHGVPPMQHTASTSCDRSDCHGGEVARDGNGIPSITDYGKTVHVNGAIDVAR